MAKNCPAMTRILAFLSVSIATASTATFSAPATPPVKTDSGPVTGSQSPDGLWVFKGIPYAAPPIGALRWKPPTPPAHWTEVRHATDFGPACIQPKSTPTNIYADDPPRMDEDCLYLNVWKPAQAHKAPVMVWIHGGALNTGNPASSIYSGKHLAERGVVVVSINYRLGILGYLAHPELSAESSRHVSGNYGLQDQIAALRWVKANIAAFGGDPANVTIFGESAGALSVMDLLASPPARGLFAKALSESGYMVTNPELHNSRYGLPSAETVGLMTAKALRANNIADLRAMDAFALVKASAAGGFVPLPTVDGWLLPDQLVEIFDRGAQAHVPLLVGFNAGELRSLRGLLPPIPKTPADYESTVKTRFADLSDAYLKLYPSDDVPNSVLAASRDGLYGWTAQRMALKQTAVGQSAYLYFFSHAYPSERPLDLEAFHASEIPFVFGLVGSDSELPVNWPKPPDTPAERALSKAMMDYWTSFARTGVPSSDAAPAWEPFSASESYMEFRDTPLASTHLLPGMYALTEELIHRRRLAGDQYWFTNIGLASPPVAPTGIAPK
jgi:para-nitrobenzyl esterase